jgi:hypothetical protein
MNSVDNVIASKFPSPDRSRQTIAHHKDEDGILDIGWGEGAMSDDRPFRAEMWAQDGVSMLTVLFSSIGLEDADPASIADLVETEGLVSYRPGAQKYCTPVKIIDDGGNGMWSVNIVVGDEDETYLDASVPIFAYRR